MRMMLLLHIFAGGLGLLSGYVALYVTKGAPLHRKSGTLFVAVMLTMAVSGMLIAAVEGVAPAINVPASVLVIYLVITSLITVRPLAADSRWLDRGAMWMALATAVGCLVLAMNAMVAGGREAGLAYPLVMFGVVALVASAGDRRRVLRDGGVQGAPRLKRHLWRMCFALFIASIAFFLGGTRVPEALRVPALLAGGVLLPLFAMSFWLWRLRGRRPTRASVRRPEPEAA